MTRTTWIEKLKNEDGNVTVFSVFMILIILMLSGAAVDVMRYESIRVKLQHTMDRAVLAAADLDQEQDPATVVTNYAESIGAGETLTGVVVSEGLNSRIVTATAKTTMQTLFMRLSGVPDMVAPALSTAEEKISNVEISVVFDISGSMRFNGRIDRAKPAAQNFVSKVLTENSNGITTLNFVPFAGHVNPGDILFDYFRGERPTEPLPEEEVVETDYFPVWEQAISNIVMYFDTDGDDIYDVAHKIEDFPENASRDVDDFYAGAVAYAIAQDLDLTSADQFLGISIKGGTRDTRYFQVKGDSNGPDSDLGPTSNRGKIPGDTYSYGQIDYEHWATSYEAPVAQGTVININMPSSCIEIYSDEFNTSNLPASEDFVPHFQYWQIDEETMDWGWCPEDDSAIQYYSSDAATLNSFIDGLRLHDGTGLQYGVKYALALLDPATRDAVGHLIGAGLVDPSYAGRPIAWNDAETEKYIVVLTDGQTSTQFRPNDPTAPVNGETELSLQDGDATSYVFSSSGSSGSDLLAQCELAKSLGVTVFTIAFETDASATADMAECASSDSHTFHVQGDEVFDTFDMIARQINNLRLTQ